MTRVFVHGVPETAAIWTGIIAELSALGVDDVAVVSPPGFGVAAPDGFEPNMDSYVQWLVGEVEQYDGPVDLVGHDWGCGHVLGAAIARPDLVRSWAVDVLGLTHPDYRWHDTAQQWRTPDVGEQVLGGMTDLAAADLAAFYEALGLDASTALSMAEAMDSEMVRCILGLYRSAPEATLAALGESAASISKPSLAIDATADPYVASELTTAMAKRLGCQTLTLQDNGHWWMAEAPAKAAQGLANFWASL